MSGFGTTTDERQAIRTPCQISLTRISFAELSKLHLQGCSRKGNIRGVLRGYDLVLTGHLAAACNICCLVEVLSESRRLSE